MDRFRNTRQPDWDWWGRVWPAPGESLRELGVRPGDAVAEVGSGNGYFALPAARIADPATVYALDIDESLLSELSRVAERQGIGNVVTVGGDARELSTLLPERVDTVLIANTLHGVEDPGPLIREASESLHPGGRLIVVNWRDIPRGETRIAGDARGPPTELRLAADRTERIVRDAAGFEPAETVDLPPYHYGLVFER